MKLSVTANCDPNLYKFPFDTQICTLYLSVLSGPASFLEAGELRKQVTFRERLLEYYIRNISFRLLNPPKTKSNKIMFVTEFAHQYGYFIISIFMPTLLLVIVSYCSFYFDSDDFTDRIMVSLTSLLVLATFISTASSNMARVSYFTLLDIWLSFCIVLVFSICLCHIVLLALGKNRGADSNETTENHWARVTPGNIMVGIKKGSEKSFNSRRRHVADVAIKSCVPIIIIVFTVSFFYIGFHDDN